MNWITMRRATRRRLPWPVLRALLVTALVTGPARAADGPAVECLDEELRIEVSGSAEKAKLRERREYVVHRVGEESDRLRTVVLFDSFTLHPRRATVTVTGTTGETQRVDLGSFARIPTASPGVFVSDDTALATRLEALVAGDTVLVRSESDLDPFLGFPLHVFGTVGMPTRRSCLEVRIPRDLEPRHREWNGAGEPAETIEKDRVVWAWTLESLDALPEERWAPPPRDRLPSVSLGVSRCAWGPIGTWEELGRSYRERVADRFSDAVRPSPEADHDRGLGGPDACLAWVQDRVRYVAVSLGSGGLVPHAAEETNAKQYGDCKDMATLLISALGQNAGARLAIVHTRYASGLRIEPLPGYSHFNHAVAYLENEDRWLDATDSYGTIRSPRFDIQGAPALVIDGPSAGWRRIPMNPPASNTITRSVRLERDGGTWVAAVDAVLFGAPAQILAHRDDKDDEARLTLWDGVRIPGWSADTSAVEVVRFAPDSARVDATVRLPRSWGVDGLRPPWADAPTVLDVLKTRERESDVYWPFLMALRDTIRVRCDGAPPSACADTTWTAEAAGLYVECRSRRESDRLLLTRTVEIREPSLAVEDWATARDLFQRCMRWSTRDVSGDF